MLVSIIIPVFNEVTSVTEVVDSVLAAPLPEGLEREVIIVDDGSTDGTSKLLENFRDNPQVRLHYSVLNFGKGVAVRVGLRYAQGDIIVIQDADLEYDPNHIKDLIEPVLSGERKVVFGSRYLGQRRGMVLLQDLGNRILTGMINLLYGTRLTDSYTCYKIFDRSVLKELRLTARGFELEAEITSRFLQMGHKILEVPIVYKARHRAQGKKIRARDGFKGLWTMIHCRLFPL